jgi:tetratricopeptide (TPR) repeat protein
MHDPPPPSPSSSPGAAPAPSTTAAPAPATPSGPSLEELAKLTAEVRKGEKLVAEERWVDAIEMLERLAVELHGRLKSRAEVALAKAYAHNPKWSRRSEKLLLSVIETDPKFVEAHLGLARIYHRGGLKARAIAAYRKALDLFPDHEEAQAAIAELTPDPAAEAAEEKKESGGLLGRLFKKS